MKLLKNIKLLIFVLVLCLLFTAVFFSIILNLKGDREDPFNPNLILVKKEFINQKDSLINFSSFLIKHKLNKIFIRERINYYYAKEEWTGYLKYGGVSYQALFAMDDSRIKIPLISSAKKKSLKLTIFNPEPSKLTYKVYLQNSHKRTLIFKVRLEKEKIKHISLAIDQTIPDTRIVLETRGKGAGAWLNPVIIAPKTNPKIVIIIVLDTLRADHTSLYGYSRDTTPALKKLARDSLVYDNAYSTSSWTLPAHVSLFSGLNNAGHGVLKETAKIALTYPLLAEKFQKRGFIPVALTGGGFVEDYYGFRRGFQIYSNVHGRLLLIDSVEKTFNRFKSIFNNYKGNDLLFFLHTYQIHAPYKAPVKYIKQINPALRENLKSIANFLRTKQDFYKNIADESKNKLIDLYDASILYSDKILVGGITRFLQTNKMYEDSMVVVLSDHGEEFCDHGSWEHGHTLYNELLKIPLVIKFPRRRINKRTNRLISIKDVNDIITNEYNLGDILQKPRKHISASLPFSPASKFFPERISFITAKHYFIYTNWGEKMDFFKPPPRVTSQYELFLHSDPLQKKNIFGKNSIIDRNFLTLLGQFIKSNKKNTGNNYKLDEELKKKLKSLGYLDD